MAAPAKESGNFGALMTTPKNVRLEVTVAGGASGTYTVEVPPETPVKVGDAWP